MDNLYCDMGEEWLVENDPLYGTEESTYLTANQLNWVHQKEIPLSAIQDSRVHELFGTPFDYSE